MRLVKKEDLYNKYIVIISNSNYHDYPIGKPLRVKIHTSKFLKSDNSSVYETNILGDNNNQITKKDIRVLTNKSEIQTLNLLNDNIIKTQEELLKQNTTVGSCWFDSKGNKVAYGKLGSDVTIKYNNSYIYIRRRFTDNCQLFACSAFGSILSKYIINKNGDIGDCLLTIYSIALQSLMLIDIKADYHHHAKNLFGNNIILEKSYISTNGSTMHLMIINMHRHLNMNFTKKIQFNIMPCKNIKKLTDFNIDLKNHS